MPFLKQRCYISVLGCVSFGVRRVPAQASVKIYTLIWAFFLHPGSTVTSPVCRMYSDIHQELERRLNEHLETKERERRQALRPDAGASALP